MNDTIETLRSQLQQLKELHEAGTLGAEAYASARAPLERRLVDLVTGAAGTTPSVPPVRRDTDSPTTATTATSPALPAAAAPPVSTSDAAARPSSRFVAGLAVAVVAIAVAGYAWTGAPSLAIDPPVASAAQDGGTGEAPPHPKQPTPEQIAQMVDKLAQRLKDKPDDPEGWTMLARAYMVLGRTADAVPAYEKATSLQPGNAGLLADYADALAVTNGRQLEGAPMKLIERALGVDPANPKALALAGTAAFDRKDYALAVQHWEKLLGSVPADSPYRTQVQAGIDEARLLGKLPGAPAAASAMAEAPQAAADRSPTAAAGGPSVSGTVTLAASLAAQAGPDDTVFVFARAAEGPRMPLAVLRKQVKDLPFEFRLDDSMAMSPAAKLSGAARVIVGARVSKTGDAIPQSGDLSGESAPVAPGASGLKIEIAEVVRK